MASNALLQTGIGGDFGLSKRAGYHYRVRHLPPKTLSPNMIFTANGRAGIALAARELRKQYPSQRDTILMPAYLCPTMLQALYDQHLHVQFYPVNDDLSINPNEICERIDERTLGVMLMHYFGFPQPARLADAITASCSKLAIIEDRTHMLLSDLCSGNGRHDASLAIYSARKWGAFPDLAVVLWPNQDMPMPYRGCDWSFGLWRFLDVFLRTLFFALPTESLRKSSRWACHRAEVVLDQRIQIRRPSLFAKAMWHYWDWETDCSIRRNNYQFLLDNWPSKDIVPIFSSLPPNICPLGFPVRTESREALKKHLIMQSVFPPVHWPRPAELAKGEFQAADAIYDQELTLPIDQRYRQKHMEHILEAVQNFANPTTFQTKHTSPQLTPDVEGNMNIDTIEKNQAVPAQLEQKELTPTSGDDGKKPLAGEAGNIQPQQYIHIRIQPSRGWVSLKLAELWEYRELLYFLTWRDIKVRYKQTVLGAAWAIIQPFFTMVVFSLFFGNLAKVPSDGIPYPIFSYAALVPWTFFSNGLTQSSNSLVISANLIKKIYFPRLVVPISSVISGVVDFGLAFIVLLAMMLAYGVFPTINVLWLPLLLLLALVTSLGVGLWLSAMNVQFRDVRYTIPFLTQFWMFATPIAYPSSLIKDDLLRMLYGLNPMTGVVEGFRWALLDSDTVPGPIIIVSSIAAVLLLITGSFYFQRMEKTFADVV